MTFAEVPIGHVFELPLWNCGCLLRRANDLCATWARACAYHKGDGRTFPLGSRVIVKYDPFLAMVESV